MTEKQAKRNTVFIAFSKADTEVAHALADALFKKDIQPILDDQAVEPGDRWADRLRSEFATVDFVLFLVSARFLSSVWAYHSSSKSLAQAMRVMNTAFVAAALDDTALPSDLHEFLCLDLRRPSAAQCNHIAAKFRAVADLDLHTLSSTNFERLILRLFEERGFESLDTSGQKNQWWDLFLHQRRASSTDSRQTLKLLVECKYYAHQRPGVREVSELFAQAQSLPPDCKALLATNSRLTSVARDWIARHGLESSQKITVLEGPELTRMLLSGPILASDELASATSDHDSHS
jgi:TIR domain/Restriction endonuclease